MRRDRLILEQKRFPLPIEMSPRLTGFTFIPRKSFILLGVTQLGLRHN